MVRHKMANLSDRQNAARRGGGATGSPSEDADVAAPEATFSPNLLTYAAEIHTRIRTELSEEEFVILDGRLSGRTNQEIAESLNKSADAVRMTWNRARQRLIERGIIEEDA